jgi:beta-N-acetylhexosaminidase
MGVPGPELNAEEADLYRRYQPGGFILFTRNIRNAKDLRKLIDDLRGLVDHEPIITIDQEGGRVSRLRVIGEEPPNAVQLHTRGTIDHIRRHGTLTGRLLRLFGFNLDLCPVLDVGVGEDVDNSLRGRTYGDSVPDVIRNAGAFNDALRAAGILSTAKHFPGYSYCSVDPHWDMPVIDRTRPQLDSFELAPYTALLQRIDSVMSCHAYYPHLEPDPRPASFSPRILKDLLRGELAYQGLIMTDDLDMGAIHHQYGLDTALELTLAAGNDLLMICHQVHLLESAVQALENVRDRLRSEIDRALENMAAFQAKLAPPTPFSESEFDAINREIYQLRVDVLGDDEARQRSPEDGKRSPVETY